MTASRTARAGGTRRTRVAAAVALALALAIAAATTSRNPGQAHAGNSWSRMMAIQPIEAEGNSWSLL